MRRGFDVSNWTGAPTSAWDALNQGNPGVLFVQSIDPPAGYPPCVTRQQIEWGLWNGWDVVPYLWKWFAYGLDDTGRKLDLIEPYAGRLLALANDIEDTSVSTMLAEGVQALPLPAEHVARIKRQPPPALAQGAPSQGLTLQGRLDQLAALFDLTDSFPTMLGPAIGTIYYGGRWYHLPYLGNTTMLAERGSRLWAAQYDGIYDVGAVNLFGGFTREAVIAKQPAGTLTIGTVGNIDPDICADDLAPPPPERPAADGDPAWLAKKGRVVQLAGELLAVADQLDDSADNPSTVRELADGVRDRAGEILG